MKVAFISPQAALCGITKYANRFVKSFSQEYEIVAISTEELILHTKQSLSKINKCDVAHMQYEASFFYWKNKNWYGRISSAIKIPIIVTLHEVYEKTPYAFAREDLVQKGLAGWIARMIYDLRHPQLTADRRNEQSRYNARLITVHHEFQKRILEAKGIPSNQIRTIPYPIPPRQDANQPSSINQKPASFCSTGFINPGYDYEYLFAILNKVKPDWKFTWIGGASTSAHSAQLGKIQKNLVDRQWGDRFEISGIVDDKKQKQLLDESRFFFALFSYRSSSDSLATAMAAGKVIFASDIPLLREIATDSNNGIIILPKDPAAAAALVDSVIADSALQETVLKKQSEYVAAHQPVATATSLQKLYNEVVTK